LKSKVVFNVLLRRLTKSYRRFGEVYCLLLQGKQSTILELLDTENEGYNFLPNVISHFLFNTV